MKKIVELLAKVQGLLGVIIFIALTIVVFLQVITRHILHAPLLWSEEVARFLLFWVVMMGASISVKNEKHFKIEIFDSSKMAKIFLRRILRLIPDLCIFIFSVFMVVVGWRYFLMSKLRIAPNSQINMQFVFAAIPIAGITMMIYSLYHLIRALRYTSSHK